MGKMSWYWQLSFKGETYIGKDKGECGGRGKKKEEGGRATIATIVAAIVSLWKQLG